MPKQHSSAVRTILTMGLIAGTLDITAAIVILAKMKVGNVFRYIASGVFEKEAFTAGPHMIAFGLVFHYLIAMTISTLYFLLFPKLPFLKTNKYLSAILIGIMTWLFMNLVVVPLSQIGTVKMTPEGILKNMSILIVCIGLPVSIFTDRYYQK